VQMEQYYNDKDVLITGGLGMIGSTVARKLVQCGANVTIVDALLKPFGGNYFNINGIEDKVDVHIVDIRDKNAIEHLIKGKDVIYSLAGQVSHNDSLKNPFLDAEINYIGHLNILENVNKNGQKPIMIYSGSRLQYGKIIANPVSEEHPLVPMTPYALNKTAAENMYMYYYNIHHIPCVLFRISNPYGPRCQMIHSKYAIINWFIKQAMKDSEIIIFGKGDQIRDYIFVDDLVDAMIKASIEEKCIGEVYNVGSGIATRFKTMVETVINVVGTGHFKNVPWPKEYINVETGNYVGDISKLMHTIDWAPTYNLEEGIQETVDYYRKYKEYYWEDDLQ